ncbi:MAG: TonB-dependent receptor [Gammaproteobacteria bacterium]|nr:MAG: TonB-dependent receptor [Gammaproteobacteria bacterium]
MTNSKVLTGLYTVALSLVFSASVIAADTVEDTKKSEIATSALDTETSAQDTEQTRVTKLTQSDSSEGVLEEVITTGTRSTKPRSAADSPVPVDVLSGEDFNAYGGTADLTDNLKNLVPSYTATPATGDGSAFVRPTSLRGTAPDQVLILVNGKRRHRSALVQFFAPAAGNGAHGVDVGMLPGIAIKRVEVLRDGAASQYGSDAIAGVINFIIKDDNEGGQFVAQYGQYYDGEYSGRFAANAGFSLGENGFINLSLEYVDNEALSRGVQRTADVANLLAAGVNPLVIGADAPFGDAPLLQTWGRPETSGARFFMNSGIDVGETSRIYLRVSYADTDGRYRFFYRNPNHSSLTPLRAMGFTGLPAGFTPFLDGAQKDYSVVGGWEGEFQNGMTYDFSVAYGQSELDYFLNNTVNPAVGLDADLRIPQMDFDVGGYQQDELNFNADFSYPINDVLNFAFGTEWREETYTVKEGEPNAYLGPGSSGFKGITPEDSGEFSRDNYALYVDLEHDVSDALLMQYALRYEDFSDFGTTLNWKLAARYRVNDRFAFRGAASTGFHAPTPGQANVRTTITTFDGTTGLQVEEGLVPSTDPRVAAVGGTELTEETSVNISVGFTADIFENTTLTLDVYQIKVDDRIYRTGDIPVPAVGPGPAASISFYTNALDVKHEGVDLVLNSNTDWSGNASTVWTFAYSYNKVSVTGQKQINGVNPVNDGLVEDIENNYPNHRFVATANTFFGEKWNLLARANYYGSHYDERGRIGAAVNPSAKIGATIYFDAELGFQMTENFRLAAGGVNIFDSFVDTIGPPNANRLSVGLQYPRRSAANYEGGAWYLKGTFSW